MSCSEGEYEAEITLIWRVENFFMSPHQAGEYFDSPTFTARSFFNTKWRLRLYPKGKANEDAGYISCFIGRETVDDGPEEIQMDFKISAGTQSLWIRRLFVKGQGYVLYKFMRQENITTDPVIECHMRSLERTKAIPVPNPILYNSFTKRANLTVPEITKETFFETVKESQATNKSVWPYPGQICGRSKLLITRRAFTCPLKTSIFPRSKERQLIPVISSTEGNSLLITLYSSSENYVDLLKIKIGFIDKLELNIHLSCKVRIVGPERDTLYISEDDHLFKTGDDNEIWYFGQPFKWSLFQRRENLNVGFELAFSDGRIYSDIEWTSDVDYDSVLPNNKLPSRGVSDEIYRLYVERKFCDVTIRVKNTTFEAHKNVLCAMSPVFAAMFESGMKECVTNLIYIDDFEPNIVHQMLHFIYTRSIEQMEFNIIMELFAVADKYQIATLHDTCSSYLKSNLTVENICDVLSLSDEHNGENLKETLLGFVVNHKDIVLLTPQWKQFMKHKVHLALEILQEVCVSLPPKHV